MMKIDYASILFRLQFISIVLLPVLLITGPALSDIAISLSGFFFIIYFFLNNKNININYNFFTIFFIVYLYLVFTSLISENYELSLESTLFYFRFFFFICAVNTVFINNKKNIEYLFFSFLITFIILISDSFYQYFSEYNILGYEYDGIRLSSFFNDEKKLGSYLSRLTPIFLGLSILIYGNSKIKIILILFLVLLIDILVILSGERSSIFYVFLSTFLITILIKKWKIYRLIAFILSFIISLTIITTNTQIKERVILKTAEQLNIFDEKINVFSIQHQVIYQTAIKIYKDHKLFGIGPKNFREKCKIEKYKTYTNEDGSVNGCQSHPHNTYIQLLTETGIFGFLFISVIFILLNIYIVKHLLLVIFKRKYIFTDYNICFLVAIYVTLWPIVPTGSFFNNWLSIIYFFPLGLLFPIVKLKDINRL